MNISDQILSWYAKAGRKTLPWQQPRTPYRVWISEIMLQQTQVNTVIPYFQKFMTRFPDLPSLAAASEDEVFSLWTGLGYYRRARFLRLAAIQMVNEYDGQLPTTLDALMNLPGIGRSTAGAILSLGYQQYASILDGNVKRVLARFYGIETWPGETQTQAKLWDLASCLTPTRQVAEYNQAMMDLGALVCTRGRPACEQCPLAVDCQAYASGEPSRLPISKPKKAMPVRLGQLAILVDEDHRVLLQKRPSTGIWGGLWGFPELPDNVNIAAWVNQAFTCDLLTQEVLPSFRHTFTHFHWDLTPFYLEVRQLHPKNLAALRWFAPGEWHEVGLPQPVRHLLQGLMLVES
jgi:A/G-specific adenine glycosylase